MSNIKNKKINLGIILILVGIIWILSNLNIIDIDFHNIISHIIRGAVDLWPLILIIIGIGIIFKNDLVNTLLWILFLVVLVVYSLFYKDDMSINNTGKIFLDEVYITDMRDDIEVGSLTLDVGAASFKIDGLDVEFIKLEQDGAFKYRLSNKDNIESLYISNKEDIFINRNARKFDLGLNNRIPWDLNMNIGAVSGKLNLEDIAVKNIVLELGAGDLEMTLGKNNDLTILDLDAGASRLVINIPKDVGVKIDFNGALSTTNLNSVGLIKTSSDKYISENYDNTKNKYEIDVDMGVGSFEINYY